LRYRARSTISTTRQRLSFDRGRVSAMRTVSPVLAVFSSSCAFTRLVRVTILPYTGCGTRRSIATTTVFCILSLTTRPTRVLRVARVWAPWVLVISAIGQTLPRCVRCSRRTVLNRASSRRITRSRSGSSSGSVALRNNRRNRSSSSSRMRDSMSSAVMSRISSARIGRCLLAGHELGAHRHLGGRQRHRLLGDVARHSLQLEHHAARLHHRDPHLGRTLALSHAGLGRLLRDWLVGKHADPDFPTALDVTRQRHTRRFNLPRCDPARLERLQTVRAERDLPTAMGQPLRAALEPLAKLDALWTQHWSSPPTCRRNRW